MSNLVERMAARYPDHERSYIYPVTKQQAAAYARSLADWIENHEDFDRFPEGALGVVLYAMIKRAAYTMPDYGDFGYFLQGMSKATQVAAAVVGEDTFTL